MGSRLVGASVGVLAQMGTLWWTESHLLWYELLIATLQDRLPHPKPAISTLVDLKSVMSRERGLAGVAWLVIHGEMRASLPFAHPSHVPAWQILVNPLQLSACLAGSLSISQR